MLRNIIDKFGISIIFVVICIIIAFQSPAFLTSNNLFNVLLQVSTNTIIAVGMTFIILTGGIDLSVGSLVAVVAVTTGTILHTAVGVPLALLLGALMGVVAGGVNGFLVARCTVPSFITTLGMMSVARGLALTITRGQTIHGFPDSFRFLGNGYIGPVPVPVILALLTVVVAHLVLTQTRFGRHVYAVGGNREAVRLSGINIVKVEWIVYAICGFTCFLGAIVLMGRLNSAQPIAGTGYELTAIAAVVIGGTSLMGGTGKITGTLMGALIIGVLQNGLTLLNVTSYFQQIIIGSVIVLAVLFDQFRLGRIQLPRWVLFKN